MREKSWEFVGRSVEEATQIALEELGLEQDDVYIEILEEPQKGFLGLGGKEARIRVTMIGEWEVIGKKESTQVKTGPVEADTTEPEPGSTEGEAPQESSEKPVQMVKDILEIVGIDAMVESKEREDSVVVDVWGEDVAIMIGKSGTTLEALQYLVNVSCRRTGEVTKRIVVDIEGYRKRRKARVEKQAEQMAQKAVSQRESIEMPAMNPSERKAVHMILRSFPGVRSESVGDEPDRRVVIYPE